MLFNGITEGFRVRKKEKNRGLFAILTKKEVARTGFSHYFRLLIATHFHNKYSSPIKKRKKHFSLSKRGIIEIVEKEKEKGAGRFALLLSTFAPSSRSSTKRVRKSLQRATLLYRQER